ncbi:class I SAM-dependent methyltransferase [Cognatilysobacter lacus]|uniref:class I SAM-dependent methyltransferase n=1 Tax=Cognatilysobacter lacus TaxID=1643323 RepID=UPI0016598AA0|nr:methyltransferase domain-containing protein [Lysobacter lacus]
MKLQIGAGLDGPASWMNVDASPTVRLQRLPALGPLFERWLSPRFSRRIVYGDVVRGLALANESADVAYSSHMLEHLAYDDLRTALREVHRVLRPGGVFRSVMPDLEAEVATYVASTNDDRASEFLRATLLGMSTRPRGMLGHLRAAVGNSQHLWLWDYRSIATRLAEAGFTDIRRAAFNDSAEPVFAEVEHFERWNGCLGFECRKAAP